MRIQYDINDRHLTSEELGACITAAGTLVSGQLSAVTEFHSWEEVAAIVAMVALKIAEELK